jgi:tetratricopeptide (TPR) repeat protein
MPTRRPVSLLAAVIPGLFALGAAHVAPLGAAPGPEKPAAAAREAAHRANNRGVACLEQYLYDDAVRAFREALTHDPALAPARVNLAIALLNVPDAPGAEREARAALAAAPEQPQALYVLGLAARGQGRGDEAQAAFREVLALDPRDVGARVNLGQLLMQERKYAEAAAEFRAALEAEPSSGTAAYNLSLALNRAGEREEGQRVMQRFEALRTSGAAKLIGTSYPDQGRYAEALQATGIEPDLVDAATPAARFVDASAELLPAAPANAAAPNPRGGVTLVDYDGDGALDVLDAAPRGLRLLRNENGRFVDVTARVGLASAQGGLGAAAGDCDADGRLDLAVLRDAGLTLYKQTAQRFVDATTAAGLGEPAGATLFTTAAFVDVDHDGDLDLVVAGVGRTQETTPGRPRLYRNDGTCAFQDDAERAGLGAAPVAAVAVAPTDYDNGRDVDLVVLGTAAPPRLYRNLRDLTFRDAARDAGLTDALRFAALAAGDVNKDGFTDLFLGVIGAPDRLATSDGRERFDVKPAPLESSGSGAALFVDYDGDGLLDLVTLGARGLRVLRNLGDPWADVSAAALADLGDAARGVAGVAGPRALAAGDLDGDGDNDLVLRAHDGALRVLRNEGADAHPAVSVRLAGRVSNKTGVGAKVEVRAGSLWQKLEASSATPPVAPAGVVFGLGRRARADAVRVLWPSGVLQTEIVDEAAGARAALDIQELDRKPSSCPYLYAWNGERFEFVTDFMGGGEMGYFEAPGVFNQPDPVEYVRLGAEQLRPRDGRYELRVTNELEEVLFVDRLALVAVTHADDVEVFPNEGMTSLPKPERLWAVRDLRPPVAARDEHGHDVLEQLTALDRRFVGDFALERIRGYAREHELALDLGDLGAHPLLLLTGWTDYAFSSDNVAAHQAGLTMQPPSLQVRDEQGRWRTAVAQIGIPVGRPQTVVVDLGGVALGPSRAVRIVTNMRIYWDQAQVGEAAGEALDARTLEAQSAELRERGFSAEVTPDGREPFGYDYERVTRASPWKVFPGRYTRLGDVRELLAQGDDLFVISRPGDEIALSFDARALPAPPAGHTRTLVLFSDGFSKEMDINSASPHTVEPLPFHAMTRYPYGPEERFPLTPGRREIMERYNTRVVTKPLPPLTPGGAPRGE